jgi:GNAT superfamily N-acetyltransferase
MTEGDIDTVIKLGVSMHQESYFKHFNYNGEKLNNFLSHMVLTPEQYCALVAEKDGTIIGFFLGFTNEHWFGTDRMSCDLACYIIPSERGSMAGVKLMKAYEEWANSNNVKEIVIGVSTGINTDRTSGLFKRLGYGDEAFSFRKRI